MWHIRPNVTTRSVATRISFVARIPLFCRLLITLGVMIAAVALCRRAEGAGILKEIEDSRRGSGFSFADFSADLAGILFADAVQQKKARSTKTRGGFGKSQVS